MNFIFLKKIKFITTLNKQTMKLLVIFVLFIFASVYAEKDGGAPCQISLNQPFNDNLNPECDMHGSCVQDPDNPSSPTGMCHCEKEYADEDCSYHRKSRLLAFLLQWFFGCYGAGYFVLGHVGLGVGILVLTIVGYALAACIVGIPILFASSIWALVVLIVIGTGSLKDVNGYETVWLN